MVRRCICCKHRVNKLESDVSLYGFPKDDKTLKKWLSAIGIKKKVYVSSRICSRHFKEDDFRYSLVGGKRFLKRGVVPSLYLNGMVKVKQFSDSQDSQDSQTMISEEDQFMNEMMDIAHLKVKKSKNNDPSLYIIEVKEEADTRNTCESVQFVSHSEPQASERLSPLLPDQSKLRNGKKFLYDVSWEEISTSPVQAKIYWEVAMEKINRQKAVMKTLQQKVRRLQGKITELQSLVKKKGVNK